MGIKGLLPALKDIVEKEHITEIAKRHGARVGIDGYCWLHKGSYSCARELCLGTPSGVARLVDYFLARLDFLVSSGLRPFVVFDGAELPLKQGTDLARQDSRRQNKERALQLLQSGRLREAEELFQRAVEITPLIAAHVIDAIKRKYPVQCDEAAVSYVVAPYEADAQLAYLAINDLVDVVITEDSDLLAFGCPRVFFKMDAVGYGEFVDMAALGRNAEPCFASFTPAMFRRTCMLAGCDYLPSLPGIGIKKAHALVRQHRGHVGDLFASLALHPKYCTIASLQTTYLADFLRAEYTFLHQSVVDPATLTMRPLRALTDTDGHPDFDLFVDRSAPTDFAGPALPAQLVRDISLGLLDPVTHQPFRLASRPTSSSLPRAASSPAVSSSSSSSPAPLWRSKRATPEPVRLRSNSLITSFFAPVAQPADSLFENVRSHTQTDAKLPRLLSSDCVRSAAASDCSTAASDCSAATEPPVVIVDADDSAAEQRPRPCVVRSRFFSSEAGAAKPFNPFQSPYFARATPRISLTKRSGEPAAIN